MSPKVQSNFIIRNIFRHTINERALRVYFFLVLWCVFFFLFYFISFFFYGQLWRWNAAGMSDVSGWPRTQNSERRAAEA